MKKIENELAELDFLKKFDDAKTGEELLMNRTVQLIEQLDDQEKEYYMELLNHHDDSTAWIYRAASERLRCKDCKSLAHCPNSSRGHYQRTYFNTSFNSIELKRCACSKYLQFYRKSKENIIYSDVEPMEFVKSSANIACSTTPEQVAPILQAINASSGEGFYLKNYRRQYFYFAAAQCFLNNKKIAYISINRSLNPFNINSNDDMGFYHSLLERIERSDVVFIDNLEACPRFASFYDAILLPLINRAMFNGVLIVNGESASVEASLDPFNRRSVFFKNAKSKLKIVDKFATFSQHLRADNKKSPVNRAVYNQMVTLESRKDLGSTLHRRSKA